jgi:hypothetical protein
VEKEEENNKKRKQLAGDRNDFYGEPKRGKRK